MIKTWLWKIAQRFLVAELAKMRSESYWVGFWYAADNPINAKMLRKIHESHPLLKFLANRELGRAGSMKINMGVDKPPEIE